ncbi:MAG: cyclase family protein [Actinomycetota bacterium]|jgi:kynurenine formamidase|nr:cyclase family protein [Actinomycetota bacterium]
MLIDITLKITPSIIKDAEKNEKKALDGHLGTHFDVMGKEFPLHYTERNAIVFDVSRVEDRDIETDDIDLSMVEKNMFIAFYTGFIESEGYGSKEYFTEHPQLSREIIEELLARKISIIGVDFAGVRRGKEHLPIDEYCAEKGVFIVENLCNLKQVLKNNLFCHFTANTYPVNYEAMTGLPCRVIARI